MLLYAWVLGMSVVDFFLSAIIVKLVVCVSFDCVVKIRVVFVVFCIRHNFSVMLG